MRIALIACLSAIVIGGGYLGPHPAPRSSPAQPVSLIAGAPVVSVPSGLRSPAPSGSADNGTDRIDGLIQLRPPANQVKQSLLPGQMSSSSMAVVGLRLFYIVNGDRIQSTEVGSSGLRPTITSVPNCQGINQLAAAGHELAFVVTSPGGTSSQTGGCGGPSPVSWTIWLLDLSDGSTRQVASGVRVSGSPETARFPIHMALTATAYAFDRPPSSAAGGPGETVEVHSLDGRTLWTSQTSRSVVDVMLGGGTLAVLTDGVDAAGGSLDLWRSDVAHPSLRRVDGPASSASISPDGSYLAWDLPPVPADPATTPRPVVGIETLDPGTIQFQATLTRADAPAPRHPIVSATAHGLVLAWLATTLRGAVYPAFRYVGGGDGAVLPSLQQPVWMNVTGSTMVWVAESADGSSKTVSAVDLSTLGLH